MPSVVTFPLSPEPDWAALRALAYGVARSRGSSPADAEDIAQVAFVRLQGRWRRADALGPVENWDAFCTKTATRLVLNDTQKRRHEMTTDEIADVEHGHAPRAGDPTARREVDAAGARTLLDPARRALAEAETFRCPVHDAEGKDCPRQERVRAVVSMMLVCVFEAMLDPRPDALGERLVREAVTRVDPRFAGPADLLDAASTLARKYLRDGKHICFAFAAREILDHAVHAQDPSHASTAVLVRDAALKVRSARGVQWSALHEAAMASWCAEHSLDWPTRRRRKAS